MEKPKIARGCKIIWTFRISKNFRRARASTRAPLEISSGRPKLGHFGKSHSNVVFGARRARKCARATNFFRNRFFVDKSRCNFFFLFISQKFAILKHFEVFRFFWKFHFFWKKIEILKNVGFLPKNVDFWWKTVKNDEVHGDVIPSILRLQMRLRYQKVSILCEELIFQNYITSRTSARAMKRQNILYVIRARIFSIFLKNTRAHDI